MTLFKLNAVYAGSMDRQGSLQGCSLNALAGAAAGTRHRETSIERDT